MLQVHKLPPIRDYCAGKYLYPKLKTLGFKGFRDMFIGHIRKAYESIGIPLEIVSVGSGNCDFEVELGATLEKEGLGAFRFTCIDISESMLDRGKVLALEKGVGDKFSFLNEDFNRYLPDRLVHIVIANNSLHHVVELEHLFDGISAQLHDDGYFLINDMIGRNGHMRWPEAEHFLRLLWKTLDERHRYNHQHKKMNLEFSNFDCSKEGFEGIRAQDILPLLRERFGFAFFFGFNNLISPLIGRSYGFNFDRENPKDKAIIDLVASLDESLIEAGVLKPTQMFAALTKDRNRVPICYKHLTPEFCTREVPSSI